jgi:amidophosphoribosyltransferase
MCGIFGAVTPGMDAAGIAALGVFSLQHRGQESAGLAVSDGEQLMLYKDLGLIAQVLDERRLPSLRGSLAIAHCRYSTTGSTIWENAQPTFRMGRNKSIAIGHNGNLVNTRELLSHLEGGKTRLPATTDTELLTALLADDPSDDTVESLKRVLPTVQGAYSLAILDQKRVIGVRDPYGFRPLVLGRLEPAADDPEGKRSGGWLLSSESAAIEVAGGVVVRDVEAGEIVILEEGKDPVSIRFAEGHEQLCVFELIYFGRPDSYMLGRNLYESRRRMGLALAAEAAVEADIVMPVPDTGAPAAAGYAEGSGLPYREGMVRNRYSGRTFIQPNQGMRQRGVTVKLSPLREVVAGKRLIVVDDSIVRGTTTRQIVALLRKAGATEIHLRISSPPIHHPCFYGIDTQIETELIASTHSVEEIREFVGADSLSFLSIGGVLQALDLPYDRFCFACFDGRYPVPVPYDTARHKFVLEDAEPGGLGYGEPVSQREAEAIARTTPHE